MRKLLLVDHEQQVKDMIWRLRLEGRLLTDNQWISLSPWASAELDDRAIPYLTQDYFIDEEELEELTDETFQKTKEIFTRWDNKYFKGITPFMYRIHEFYLVLSNLYYRIYCLKKILEGSDTNEVWVHTTKWYAPVERNFVFDQRQCLWGRILALPGWENLLGRQLNIKILPEVKSSHKRVKTFQPSSTKLFVANMIARFLPKKKEKGILLLITPVAEWKSFIKSFVKEGYKFQVLDPNKWCRKIPKIFQLYFPRFWRREVVKENPFVFEEQLDFLSILILPFKQLFQEAEYSMKVYSKACKYLRKLKPKAILTSTKFLYTFVVCRAARDSGIPVYTVQHGSMGYYYHKTLPYLDLVETDYFVTYGSKVVSIYQDLVDELDIKIIHEGEVIESL